ncbi:MAG: hypothetical protein WC866_04405 [Patescibacteria group bacterium]|jgi:hypothetical protein
MHVREDASAEEIRDRQETWERKKRGTLLELLPARFLLTGVVFVATLVEKRRPCAALKEAWSFWRLEVFK